jgi:hypothetical protein
MHIGICRRSYSAPLLPLLAAHSLEASVVGSGHSYASMRIEARYNLEAYLNEIRCASCLPLCTGPHTASGFSRAAVLTMTAGCWRVIVSMSPACKPPHRCQRLYARIQAHAAHSPCPCLPSPPLSFTLTLLDMLPSLQRRRVVRGDHQGPAQAGRGRLAGATGSAGGHSRHRRLTQQPAHQPHRCARSSIAIHYTLCHNVCILQSMSLFEG